MTFLAPIARAHDVQDDPAIELLPVTAIIYSGAADCADRADYLPSAARSSTAANSAASG